MENNNKYITFKEGEPNENTKRWNVLTKDESIVLGEIKWFSRWYCYSFFPANDTLFEKTCLRDIANFCEEETKKKRANWYKAKRS